MRYLLILLLFIFSTPTLTKGLFGEEILEETLATQYHITLPGGDRGTIYLLEDHSLQLLPYFTNQSYTHVCGGRWKFNKKEQILAIRDAKRCTVLNGRFRLNRGEGYLTLKDGLKTLTFETMPSRR